MKVLAQRLAKAVESHFRQGILVELSSDLDQFSDIRSEGDANEYIGLQISNPDNYDMVIYRIRDKAIAQPTIGGPRFIQVRQYAVDVMMYPNNDYPWAAPDWIQYGTCNGSVFKLLIYVLKYELRGIEDQGSDEYANS